MKVGIYILAGGSGKRLWPITRKDKPKWNLKAPNGDTLLSNVVCLSEKILNHYDGDIKILLKNRSQIYSLRFISHEDALVYKIFEEDFDPSPKDTATAIECALKAKEVIFDKNIPDFQEDDICVILPSDFIVKDEKEFVRAVCECIGCIAAEKFIDAKEKRICVLGAPPTYANTAYGYISRDGKFHEKPNLIDAANYILNGYLWNMGVIICDPKYLLKKLEETPWEEKYGKSIDYAILEKEERVHVEPCDCGWDDLGTIDRYLKKMNLGNTFDPQKRIIDLTSNKPYILDVGDKIVIVDQNQLWKLRDFYETQLEERLK